ncbi:DivIVA domain-containing protein [Zafaria sp. J156]|uniref:DivIVA domain-containing protein n=1 Tax=Zafaria sp. J156 TaxID=3116490 RepID=UPI002E7987BF|nr:DivIVA domain-containing protein [Zafaria sp. J156]MEE1620394.1 DivIVA domain-containing protein [Zafaria sp. J156]
MVYALLLFIAIALLGAAALFASGRFRRSVEGTHAAASNDGGLLGLVEPVATLPPVLLPARPGPDDVERLRLAVGLRGYRCDQVDEVLGELGAEIGRLNDELDALRKGL